MTREDILALPAGPELDCLLAERVMGWRRLGCWANYLPSMGVVFGLGERWHSVFPDPAKVYYRDGDTGRLWEPSASADDALRAADALAARGAHLTLEDWRGLTHAPAPWAALFDLSDGHDTGHAVGETAPHAICLAALLALHGEPAAASP